MWQDQALYKEAGGRETTPHQDQTFWPIGDAPLISAWIPLTEVTAEDGAMAYVPGSHLAGKLSVVDITHSTEPYDILRDPALGGEQLETVAIKPGSVIWHHGFTVHAAAANESSHTRKAFTVVYLAANSVRTKTWPAFPLDRAGVAVGQTIQGEGMPQLWPPLQQRPDVSAARGSATGPQQLTK